MGMKCGGVRRYEEPIHNLRQLCEIDCFNTKKLRTVIVSIVKTPSPQRTHGAKFAIRSGCYLLKFVPQTIDVDVVPFSRDCVYSRLLHAEQIGWLALTPTESTVENGTPRGRVKLVLRGLMVEVEDGSDPGKCVARFARCKPVHGWYSCLCPGSPGRISTGTHFPSRNSKSVPLLYGRLDMPLIFL